MRVFRFSALEYFGIESSIISNARNYSLLTMPVESYHSDFPEEAAKSCVACVAVIPAFGT